MTTVRDTIAQGRYMQAQRPWPRAVITAEQWQVIAAELAAGRATLLGLWGDTDAVHLALLLDPAEIVVATVECPDGTFPSVGAVHAPAIRLERAIHDLYGFKPVGAPDTRPWLDLGFWDVQHPLGNSGPKLQPAPYAFLPTEGEGLHQIPVGPVHAGIIEPGHFRFTANGETVVRLEERLGYVHKGIESLMIGTALDKAARLAGRTSGDSTVAYALAFARAVEAALEVDVPPRAHYLRALMAELERLANHFGDIGAICNDASFAIMHAQCGILRERALRTAEACFGHRLMMDRVVPGGVSVDLAEGGIDRMRWLLENMRRRFPELIEIYDNTASLQDRTATTGILRPELARKFGAGGYVGRASGRGFDVRRVLPYPPYQELKFDIPVFEDGDVNARVWVRIREVEQSMTLIDQIIRRLPDGAICEVVPGRGETREGLGWIEGFRGDVLAWVRVGDDGRIARCHLRDPSWFQWPLLEAVVEGNIVADFPLCNKSFNCSYSGHDL
ncbi:MAG: NADH-quinone oxidoreductase subunit C [Xanthobacteraceae bacterium]